MPAPFVAKASIPSAFAIALAFLRICYGALVIRDCWRFIRDDRVWLNWTAPDVQVSHPGPAWIAPLPEAWLELAWLCVGVAGLFVMLALFYRTATVALILIVGYFLQLDAAEPLAHLHLILLGGLTLLILPRAQVCALDAGNAAQG